MRIQVGLELCEERCSTHRETNRRDLLRKFRRVTIGGAQPSLKFLEDLFLESRVLRGSMGFCGPWACPRFFAVVIPVWGGGLQKSGTKKTLTAVIVL